jgi:hypothetical protein
MLLEIVQSNCTKRRAVFSTVSCLNECTPAANFYVDFGQTEEKRKRVVNQSSEFVFSSSIIAKICSRRRGTRARVTSTRAQHRSGRDIKNSTRSEWRKRKTTSFQVLCVSLSFSFGNIMLLERGYYILEICPYDFFQRWNFLLLLLDVCVSSLGAFSLRGYCLVMCDGAQFIKRNVCEGGRKYCQGCAAPMGKFLLFLARDRRILSREMSREMLIVF